MDGLAHYVKSAGEKMIDFDILRKKTLEFEFSVIVLTSYNKPTEKLDGAVDECINHDLTRLMKEETIPGIIENAKNEKFELIIIDNGSEKEHLDYLLSIPQLHQPTRLVFNYANLGVSGGWNQGLKIARGEYICIVSNDMIIKTPNYLRILQKPMLEDFNVVSTGPEASDIGVECIGIGLKKLPYADYITVNCQMIRKEWLEEIGYLDEMCYPYMGEDTEFGIRAWKNNKKVMKVDLPSSFHWGQRSVQRYWSRPEINISWDRNRKYIKNKHKDFLEKRAKENKEYR